jgi:hypothetical protein
VTLRLEPEPCARFDATARERLFRGALLVFRGDPAVGTFVAALRKRVVAAMAPHDPPVAQQHLDRAELAGRCNALVAAVERDDALADMLTAALVSLGADPAATWRDRLRLRIQTSDGDLDTHRSMTLPPHRDTWGSNVMAQVNWWAPLWPVDEGRTVAMWPDRFAETVPNTSAAWDLEELVRRRRAGDESYPLLPVADPSLELGPARPVVIAPGEIMAFSGAHLHAGTVNRTGLVRYSFEVRTVNGDDLAAGHGAPNVDGQAPRRPLGWFHRLSDSVPLSEAA